MILLYASLFLWYLVVWVFFLKKRIHIRILTICHFLSSLNATDFLERLRGKKLVFVGDSLNRNMWESLVCILRNSIRNKKRVYEISGRREFKKKGFYAFIFEASFRRVLHLWLEEFSFFYFFNMHLSNSNFHVIVGLQLYCGLC